MNMFWNDAGFTDSARAALVTALNLTGGAEVEPDHLLIALLDDPGSALARACATARPGVDLKALQESIVTMRKRPGLPVSAWSERLVSAATRKVISDAASGPDWPAGSSLRREGLISLEALRAVRPGVRKLFGFSGIDPADLEENLANPGEEAKRPQVFNDDDSVNLSAFDRFARAVLQLVETEGRGLGLSKIGVPLVLFSLVSRNNGLLERALRLQVISPRRLHESLLLQLRAIGRNRINDALVLRRDLMQSTVVASLERAADLAYDRHREAIGEAEVIKALLLEDAHFVATAFGQLKVDVKELAQFVDQYSPGDEPSLEEPRSCTIAEIGARLRDKIVGQDHAITLLMPYLKRLRFGYPRRNRPMGVFLFLGASGTGKTQLAKEVATVLYGSDERLIFLEMGQFGDEFSKTIFVGAPPGYRGYGEGLLTNGLRDKPESVVLFDEVEKAHKTVFDVVLRFLDEGQIADPAGPVRDGRKCIIVLTSNLAIDALRPAIEHLSRSPSPGPDELSTIRAEIRSAVLLSGFFRPEFINRVDDLILFNTLGQDDYRRILRNQIDEERRLLKASKGLEFTVLDQVVDDLVAQCVLRSGEGARVCDKLISTLIVGKLIDFFADETNAGTQSARVCLGQDGTPEIMSGP